MKVRILKANNGSSKTISTMPLKRYQDTERKYLGKNG
jgi:hypothetical protein